MMKTNLSSPFLLMLQWVSDQFLRTSFAKTLLATAFLLVSVAGFGQNIFISQYIETNSGTTPKGIEVMNPSTSDIVFSETNNLQVYQGTNGAQCTSIVNIKSGTLKAGEVWVIGTEDVITFATNNGTALSGTTKFAFAFNGDDALQIHLAGVLKDVFGNCGNDPGTNWSGSGVSTADNNLQIKTGICSGIMTNWTDPSLRFDQIAVGSTMTGFGNPPSCVSGKTVTFKGNGAIGGGTGGTGADYTQTAAVNPTALTTNTFTRTGYTFANWHTLAAGTGGTSYTNGQNYDFSADMDLFAQWTINQYDVTYNLNGGTGTTPTTQTANYNTNVTLADDSGFSRAGYSFNGWNTLAGGTGTHYNANDTFTIPANNTPLFAEWVSTAPTLTTTGTISAISTTYGTASANQSFTFTASNLTGTDVTVTPPAGFEIATTSGGTYGNSLTYPISYGSASGSVFVRLAATTDAGTYTGNISLTDASITPVNVNIPNSTVNKKALTLTGLTGVNKAYDGNATATVTGTGTVNGTVNSDVINLTGTATYSFADKNIGTAKQISVAGFTLSGSKAANYTLTLSNVATANITAKPLTVTGATVQNKSYDGTNTATITGATLVGVISPDVVTITGSGTFAQANVGTAIAVTANLSLGSTDAGNYTLTQPSGLSADITKANQTIIFNAIPDISVNGTYNLTSSATSSSGLTLSFSSASSTIASVSGTTVTGVAVGTTTITATQLGDSNYNAATAVAQTVEVKTTVYTTNDYRTKSGGSWTTATNTNTATWQKWNGTDWVDSSRPTANTHNVFIRHAITSGGNSAINNLTIIANEDTNPVTYGSFTSTHIITVNGDLTIKSNCLYSQEAALTLQTTSNFEIEDNATFKFSNTNSNPPLFVGIEKFHPESNFYIVNFDDGTDFIHPTSTTNKREVTANTYFNPLTNSNYTALFGNLYYADQIGGDMNLITNVGAPSFNITHRDLIIDSDKTDANAIGNTSNDEIRLIRGSQTIGIGRNVIVRDGYFIFTNGSNQDQTVNIEGDLILEGNDGGTAVISGVANTATGKVNIKGNLKVSGNTRLASNDVSQSYLNFNADNSSTGFQTIDFNSANTDRSYRLGITIDDKSITKLINQDLQLGTSSYVMVKSGGTLDFGFNGSNTALNIVRITSPNVQAGQSFNVEDGGTLKITSPMGITNGGDYTGNVQIGTTTTTDPATSTRYFSPNSTYHYIGKGTQQVSGNGLPGAAGDKKVIVELENDNVKFWATPQSGAGSVKRFSQNGWLEIRRGTVLDGQNPDVPSENYGRFADAIDTSANTSQSANLRMTGGRYVLYHSGYAMPHFSGTYDLTGGVIQFDGNDQSIRAPKTYLTVEVTGKKVGTPAGNITLKSVSSPSAIDGSLTVKNGGEFLINNNSIVGDTGNQTVTVESGGIFNTGDSDGFSGNNNTSVQTSIENITLEDGSTVEYSSGVNQVITEFKPLLADFSNVNTGGYYNLKISGNDGTVAPQKTIAGANTYVRHNLAVSTELSDNAQLVVNADKALTVKNNIISKAPDNFLVESGGNLVQINDAAENVGGIKVYRGITFSNGRKEYNFYSSPVKGQNMKELFGVSANTPFAQVLDEPNNVFKLATDLDYEKIGKGFAVKDPKSSYTIARAEFKGVPNNGIHDVEVTRAATPTNRGWNLVGNPYPSNIDAKLLYDASTNIHHDFRFWDNTVNATYTYNGSYGQYSYAILNASTGEGNPAPGADPTSTPTPIGTKAPDRYISVGQGFIVRALTPAGGTVKFSNAKRTATKPANVYFGKNATAADSDRYRIQLKTPKGIVLTNTIAYNESWSNDFGNDDSRHPGLSSLDLLYNMVGEEKVVINGRSGFTNEDVIPLGYKAYERGSYIIRLRDQVGLFANNGQVIYLKDKQTGTTADLSQVEYEFTTEAGEFTNRFEIVYQPDAVLTTSTTASSPIEVYHDGEDFVVYSFGKKINRIEVYDASGRLVLTQGVNSQAVRLSALKILSGLYIVRTILIDGNEFVKKFRR